MSDAASQQPAASAPAPTSSANTAAAQQQPPPSGLPPVLDDLTKKTIDILGRVLKKTPLTQKLLAKPPFRYLHDVFSELIRTCGFAQGLYDDNEMNSENVKEKDAKVAYLTKMIDCVGLATGLEIRANPLKIVAGLEPEETNALLQLIGKVVIKKVDTKNAIARVLAGEHQGKKPAAAPANTAAPGGAATAAAPATAVPSAAQPAPKQAVAQPAQSAKQLGSPPSSGSPATKPQPSGETARKETSLSSGNLKDAAAKQVASQSSATAAAAVAPAATPQQIQGQSAASASQVSATSASTAGSNVAAGLPPKPGTAAPKESPQKPAQPHTSEKDAASGPKLPKTGSNPDVIPMEPSAEAQDSGVTDRDGAEGRVPQATIKRRERPISARPAPPKQRPAEVAAEDMQPVMPAIIPDHLHKDDDEDEDFVVRAVESLNAQQIAVGAAAPAADEKHGGLVQRILQNKKDLEGQKDDDAQKLASGGGVGGGGTAITKDTKSSTLKEIEALRASIQLLCQSTNPLGKTMDYMQEDVDSMNKELDMWIKERQSFKALLDTETKATIESLVPFESQLKSIEENITEQLEKIASAKATIIQNDAAIQKILRGITSASK
eukprot:jgi/Hompol1/5741/HPOL_004665-RA